MTVPTVYPTGLLTGRFVDLAGDPMTGQVNITAATIARSIALVGSGLVVWGGTVSFTLDADGRLPAGLYLPATDTDQTNPTGFTYRVSLSWRAQDFHIQVPAGSTQDLADIMPVAESAGVITVPAEPRPATEVTSTQLAEAIAANAESTATAIGDINISTGDLQLDLDLSSTNALIEATNAALADPLHVIVDSGASAGGLTDDELRAAPVVVHLDQAIDVQSDALTDDELRAAPLHVITDNPPDLTGLATAAGQATAHADLAAILTQLAAGLGVTVDNQLDLDGLATEAGQATIHADLGAIFAKLAGDPATQATLAAVLALLTAGIKTTEQAPLNLAGLATTARQDVTHADLAAILAKLAAAPALDASVQAITAKLGTTLTTDVADRAGRLLGHVTVDNPTAATDVSTLATQATLAAVLAKLSGDPATQTTLAAVLAKLNAGLSTDVADRAGRLLGHVTVDNPTAATDVSALAKDATLTGTIHADLAAILAKLIASPATEATLAAAKADLDTLAGAVTGGVVKTSAASSVVVQDCVMGSAATPNVTFASTGRGELLKVFPVAGAAVTGSLVYRIDVSYDGGNAWVGPTSVGGSTSYNKPSSGTYGVNNSNSNPPLWTAGVLSPTIAEWTVPAGVTHIRVVGTNATLSADQIVRVLRYEINRIHLGDAPTVAIGNTVTVTPSGAGVTGQATTSNSETSLALVASGVFTGSSRTATGVFSGGNVTYTEVMVVVNTDVAGGTLFIEWTPDSGTTWLVLTSAAIAVDANAATTLTAQLPGFNWRVRIVNGATPMTRLRVVSRNTSR